MTDKTVKSEVKDPTAVAAATEVEAAARKTETKPETKVVEAPTPKQPAPVVPVVGAPTVNEPETVVQPNNTAQAATTRKTVVRKARLPRAPKQLTNSTTLPWPQDQGGITTLLKREIARSVGRMAGNPDHLKTVLGTLEIGARHAQDKFDAQLRDRKADLATRAKRKAEAQAESDRQRLRNLEVKAENARAVLAEYEAAQTRSDALESNDE